VPNSQKNAENGHQRCSTRYTLYLTVFSDRLLACFIHQYCSNMLWFEELIFK